MSKNLKLKLLLPLQILLIGFAGFFSGDSTISIVVAIIGVAFNLFVSLNIPVGFLIGVAYAIINGVLSFQTGAYASCIFMLFLQAPMAVYSFISWKSKKKKSLNIMKSMTAKQICLLSAFMAVLSVIMFCVLSLLNGKGSGIIFDDVFFVFSVTACFLLAFCYKNAYIITLLSGIGGTLLWSYQMIAVQKGLAVAVFYFIVAVNSVVAIKEQYGKQS